MSTRASNWPMKGLVREPRRRKMVLDLDLNDVPPSENRAQEGTTTSRRNVQVIQVCGRDGGSAQVTGRLDNTPIDVEAFDDDVLISSPRRFTQARNNSRRNHVVVLDENPSVHQNQSDEPITRLTLNSFNSRGRNSVSGGVINCDLYQSQKRKRIVIPSREPPRSKVPKEPQITIPKEPIFTCAVCMGPLVESTSTICGHIFCNGCIKAAITAQKKCPTCRHKLTNNNIHRVYLPTS